MTNKSNNKNTLVQAMERHEKQTAAHNAAREADHNATKAAQQELIKSCIVDVKPVETAEQATVDKLFAEVVELSTEEFNTLCNRLSLAQLETLQKLFEDRIEAEKDKSEKEILTARNEQITPENIAAVRLMLSAEDTTAEILKTLPKSLFNQLFIAALAAQQPEKQAKSEKHNDLSHKFMLSVACYAYIKEANVDNFNSRPVQLLETLTLADFEKHCLRNTFANNTTFPVTIDGKQYTDKPAAVKAMASLMFNWYTASVKAVA